MENIRIDILEYVGWTELSREGRLNDNNALRGIDPVDGQRKIAPNPTTSLDSLHKIVKILSTGKYCGSIYERYSDSIYEGGLALEGAEVKSKQLYYVLYPEPE